MEKPEPPNQKKMKPAIWIGEAFEAIPFFLFGTLLSAIGVVALINWCIEQWRMGAQHNVYWVAVASILWITICLIATRSQRKVIALAFVLSCVGFLAIVAKPIFPSFP